MGEAKREGRMSKDDWDEELVKTALAEVAAVNFKCDAYG